MSQIEAAKVKVGQSGIPAENFTLRSPNDGTFRVSRGNPGAEVDDPIVVAVDGSVEFQFGVTGKFIGGSVAPVNLTGSRIANTTYTNTSGTFKIVSVSTTFGGSTSTLLVDGIVMSQAIGNNTVPFSSACAAVGPGKTYRFNCGGAVQLWTEQDL